MTVAENNKLVSIIIPCFNEEGNIYKLYETLENNISTDYNWEFIFVDDGSSDQTIEKIKALNEKDQRVKYISFSRNFGHQYALKAGLDFCNGDCAISMDADLQHPPSLMKEMLKFWEEGNQIVYSIRKDDENTSFLKRKTSKIFYSFINYLSEIDINQGAADYRLLDRQVIEIIKVDIKEYNLFLRGLISWVGFNQIGIEYYPEKRFSGASKYSYKKMINFALTGITSFSVKPLRVSMLIGFFLSIFSFIYGIYALIVVLFHFQNVSGWASIIACVLFIGGIQLMILGILGEYIGKIYFEVKKRPLYIIKETKIK
jgi:glycosyltransferase involved in cell wall biosynthesis